MQCMSDRFNRLEDDVDAARLQSVRVTGGTGNIFTNYHLFVLHADILHISSFMYVNPVVRRIDIKRGGLKLKCCLSKYVERFPADFHCSVKNVKVDQKLFFRTKTYALSLIQVIRVSVECHWLISKDAAKYLSDHSEAFLFISISDKMIN